MFGVSPYGCVPIGGLIETAETTFPLTLALSESEIYTVTLSEA